MKRFLFITLFIAQTVLGFAQMVYIPDPNFRAFLQTEYPNCMDGDSLDSQCAEVVQEDILSINGNGLISDLTG